MQASRECRSGRACRLDVRRRRPRSGRRGRRCVRESRRGHLGYYLQISQVKCYVRTTGGCCTCCCAGEGLFNTKLTGPGEVFLQSYSHGKFKNYAIEWYLGNRASAGLARFASRGGAAADPFGAPPAADTEVIQRRGNNAPAPVPAAAPMDRKGR